MGNDGGSIPDRRDLVRSKPKAEQADKANQTRARWFSCALSKVHPLIFLLTFPNKQGVFVLIGGLGMAM